MFFGKGHVGLVSGRYSHVSGVVKSRVRSQHWGCWHWMLRRSRIGTPLNCEGEHAHATVDFEALVQPAPRRCGMPSHVSDLRHTGPECTFCLQSAAMWHSCCYPQKVASTNRRERERERKRIKSGKTPCERERESERAYGRRAYERKE